MENWIIWISIFFIILAPLVITARTIRNLLISVRLSSSSISTLPDQGWVQVRGRIRGDPVSSPINKLDCSFYQLEVKEYRSYGRGGNWRTILIESSAPFELDDMTGRVTVQKANTQVVVRNDSAIKVDDDVRNVLTSLGVTTTGLLGFNKRLKVYQRMIARGEETLVVGKIMKREDIISSAGRKLEPIVISSFDKAGMVKALAWKVAGKIDDPHLPGGCDYGRDLFIGNRYVVFITFSIRGDKTYLYGISHILNYRPYRQSTTSPPVNLETLFLPFIKGVSHIFLNIHT
jgi:hypothetical protein